MPAPSDELVAVRIELINAIGELFSLSEKLAAKRLEVVSIAKRFEEAGGDAFAFLDGSAREAELPATILEVEKVVSILNVKLRGRLYSSPRAGLRRRAKGVAS